MILQPYGSAHARQFLLTHVVVIGSLLVALSSAAAHGPCDACISPKRGTPGTLVVTKTLGVRVVWNPSRRIAWSGSLKVWRLFHRASVSRTVARSPQPRPHQFRVPRTAAGLYAVLIFDGTDGRSHYTWAYFEVVSHE